MGAIDDSRRRRDVDVDVNADVSVQSGAADERVSAATTSAERLTLLLERVALVTRAGDGGATLLFALGRIASSSRWLDESFCVEISGDDEDSKLEIFTEAAGDGERTRVVPPTRFAVPVAEFIAAVDADPSLVGSLRVQVEAEKLLLRGRTSGVHPRFDGLGEMRADPRVHAKTTFPRMSAARAKVIGRDDPRREPEDD